MDNCCYVVDITISKEGEMIKYCCFYCAKFKKCQYEFKRVCYSALGGAEYVKYCKVKDGVCAEVITGNGSMAEAHKDCWVAK